ncbi:MAG: methylenetetrahydrofolate--tRNA-(uracil(54)-C(5))-methyltransferase (FADH(2)-oxidizing) TrmFO [Oligoflexales bacterium]
MSLEKTVHIVGGGLAGSEAAYQCLRAGHEVVLHEMRPVKLTAAHQTGNLAELVCSNSLKSMLPDSAPGLLKYEMSKFGSLILEAAEYARVPAGQALAVDREKLSGRVEEVLKSFTKFKRLSEEVTELPSVEQLAARNEVWIVATGPLTASGLLDHLKRYCRDEKNLYFYDAIAPIIDADTINFDEGFWASRYDDGAEGDYFNIPLNKEEYYRFVDDVAAAEKAPLHDFEEAKFFEACLPIEVMIERGRDTLRFGPMKPVGLNDPRTGRRPYAAIQLRKENTDATMLGMVGFQTKMTWTEQKRIFATLPCLREAQFHRFGSIHRNTYFHSPNILNTNLSFKEAPGVFLAGQITGVEGYTESSAMGLLAGLSASAYLNNAIFKMPPKTTMIGALHNYVTQGSPWDFQPMNVNLGLLPRIHADAPKQERKKLSCEVARAQYDVYFSGLGEKPETQPGL